MPKTKFPTIPTKKRRRRHKKGAGIKKGMWKKFASNFERKAAEQLLTAHIPFDYELGRIEYLKMHYYIPDFKLPNGVIVETKGRFTTSDRAKHILIRKQHPEVDIRFVFMRNNKLNKKSETTYEDWCKRYGFKYAFDEIPEEWLEEVRAWQQAQKTTAPT